ncbi:MAG: hypothetical protein LLG20_24220 [Acidobacteriales bacterium]|nr:hypothetical protein [Terriglobales bacterium]
MRITTKGRVSATFVFCALTSGAGQELDSFTRARMAVGGRAGLQAVKTLLVEGTFTRLGMASTSTGSGTSRAADSSIARSVTISGDITVKIYLPDRIWIEERMLDPMGTPGPIFIKCVNGNGVWTDVRAPEMLQANAGMKIMQSAPPSGAALNAIKVMASRYLLALLLQPRPPFPATFAYVGVGEAPDGQADVLRAQGQDGNTVQLFLDRETSMPRMFTYTQEGRDIQVRLQEYREVGGIRLPHLLTIGTAGQVTNEVRIQKYRVNQSMSDKDFDK